MPVCRLPLMIARSRQQLPAVRLRWEGVTRLLNRFAGRCFREDLS